MTNKLLIASAGAGKTHRLAKSACVAASDNKRILILTYTRSNQQEIKDRCVTLGGAKQGKIDVKGWYTFLLEDIVRPYQSIFFKNRIKSINFNQSNPHKKGNTTIVPLNHWISMICHDIYGPSARECYNITHATDMIIQDILHNSSKTVCHQMKQC